MKILFDFLYIVNEEPSGLKKYGFKLVEGFLIYSEIKDVSILCDEKLYNYISSHVEKKCNYITIKSVEKKIMCKNYSRFRNKYPKIAEEIEKHDFVISTCANYPLVLFSPYVKHIGVIHDLQMLKLIWKGKNVLKDIYFFFDVKRRIKKLENIVVISRNTYNAILKFTKRHSRIIYNAVEQESSFMIMPKSYPFISYKIILDVNTYYRYKNADLLIKAFALIHDEYPDYRLYFKGNMCKDFERLPRLAQRLGVLDKIYFDTNNRSEEEMNWLYSNSSIFVSPSLMEGFGMTPIEAIEHGIVTFVSDIKTLKEVVKDCATFFNPYSYNELAELLKKEIDSPTPITELNRRKNKMSETYSRKKQVLNFLNYINSI